MSTEEKLVKSKARVQKFAEVYTPDWLVEDMLNMIPPDAWESVDKTFLEPSCGNGNFLVAIYRRKLAICHDADDALLALASIFAVDILPDNVAESRERLYNMYKERYGDCDVARAILERNIVCGNTLLMKTAEGNPIWFLTEGRFGG